MKRLAMSTLAKDMDSWIEKRDDLSRKLEDLREQKQNAMKSKVSIQYIHVSCVQFLAGQRGLLLHPSDVYMYIHAALERGCC